MISVLKNLWRFKRHLGSVILSWPSMSALSLPASKGDPAYQQWSSHLRWAKRCQRLPLARSPVSFWDHPRWDYMMTCGQNVLQRSRGDGLSLATALGGLSVGEKNEQMVSFCKNFVPQMIETKPRYLMGVGKPLDILNGIRAGLDMFDCVLPTRNARNGQFLTKNGPLNIKKERFKEDQSAPDPSCECRVCQRYSRSYIRHLFNVGEYLAGQLITYHNLHFYLRMTEGARSAILENKFDEYYEQFYKDYTEERWK
jgi:queuine tRNA-ribosyltransferase